MAFQWPEKCAVGRAALGLLTALALAVGMLTTSALAESGNPLAPPDTSSPRATIEGFRENVAAATRILVAAHERNTAEPGVFPSEEVLGMVAEAEVRLERASRYLDLSAIPPVHLAHRKVETTLILKEVLDRLVHPEATAPDDGNLTGWTIPDTEIRIERIKEGTRQGDFLFSADTVDRSDEFYAAVKALPDTVATIDFYDVYRHTPGNLLPPKWLGFVTSLPEPLRKEMIGVAIWQWIGLAMILVVAAFVLHGAVRLSRKIARAGYPTFRILGSLVIPAALALISEGFLLLAVDELNIIGPVERFLEQASTAITVLAIFWVTLSFSSALGRTVQQAMQSRREGIDASIARAAIQTTGIAAATVVVIYGASYLGVPLAGLLAGLGVGGLAIALAAKPTLENFIGGMILYVDRPVRVGDLCRFNNLEGRVEEIGIRSTRLRARDRSLITIPNSVFVDMNLINLSNRDSMPFERVATLNNISGSDDIRRQIAALRAAIAQHPLVEEASIQVRLKEGYDSNPSVDIRALIETKEWKVFLEAQQDLDLILRDKVRELENGPPNGNRDVAPAPAPDGSQQPARSSL